MKLVRQSDDTAAARAAPSPGDEPLPWFIREVRSTGASRHDVRRAPDAIVAPAPPEPLPLPAAPTAAKQSGVVVGVARQIGRARYAFGIAVVVVVAFFLGWQANRTPRVADLPVPRIAAAPIPTVREPVPLRAAPRTPPAVASPTPSSVIGEAGVRTGKAAPATAVRRARALSDPPRRVRRLDRTPADSARRRDPPRARTARVKAAPATLSAAASEAPQRKRPRYVLPQCKGFQVYRPTTPCSSAPPR